MSAILSNKRKHTSVQPIEKHGTDSFALSIPKGEVYHGCRLTILESDRHSSAKVTSQPQRGAHGKQKITVDWKHGAGDKVDYQLEAFTRPADAPRNAPSPTRLLTGFVPSEHGFHFANAFPSVPDITIPIPFGKVEFGDASQGLCGGMVFFALDHYLAKRPIPAMNKPPVSGDLFDRLVSRLLNSFNLPMGILNYIVLMNPNYPDDDEGHLNGNVFAPHGRAWQTIRVEWPIIKAMLDSGQPCPLGLVRVKSTELSELGKNHQVLATGYDVVDDLLTLFIYDPNYPNRNDLTLSMSLANPELATPIKYSALNDLPVFAFFRVKYKFRSPPVIT